jgi:hypothetical protein
MVRMEWLAWHHGKKGFLQKQKLWRYTGHDFAERYQDKKK